jgi:hypothetical protein
MPNITAKLDETQTKDFLIPLQDLIKNCGDKVIIRFLKDKQLVIKASNDQKNIYEYVHYNKSIAELFECDKDYRLGLHNLTEFVSLAKIFQDGLEFKFIDTEKKIELLSTKNNREQTLEFYTCEESIIPQPKEALDYSKIKWCASFDWDNGKYDTILSAMKNLKYPNISFIGKIDNDFISVVITDVDIKTTSYKTKIQIDEKISEAFNIKFDKTFVINALTGCAKNYKIKIHPKLLQIKGNNNIVDTEYIIFPLVGK